MDADVSPSGDGPTATIAPPGPSPFAFTGTTDVYFRIWIVNLVLTIVTLGIWSAWAKVRRQRFFLGNTEVFDDRFDFLADSWTILKGRLIAVTALAIYGVAGGFEPDARIVLVIAVLPAMPWVINRALAFRCRNTVWRNVQMRWHGTYWGSFKAFILWPALSLVPAGLLIPYATRASQRYIARHIAFGHTRFDAAIAIAPLYRALVLAAVLFFALYLVMYGALVAAMWIADDELAWEIVDSVYAAVPIFALFIAVAFYRARARNVMVRAMASEGRLAFKSSLSGLYLAWIVLSNFFAVLFTLGLLVPWAQMRLWRAQTETLAVFAHVSLASFTDANARDGRAAGEEFADFGGIGIGV
ncbi:MAG: DUF898 domain-containing protein [Alphaproteobacteria bacterium]|nr:DUF898 domain-containing protein [Alphaproteobacteria bacterium]